MSITLDVNAFLNKDVCSQSGCNGGGSVGGPVDVVSNADSHDSGDVITMEKEMETTNIFEEIEHLLKFNKNLEYSSATPKEDEKKVKAKKTEETKRPDSFNLDFLSHTDDFLLASETQSLLGEDPLLFSVEQDRLQPLTSKFMVPGIYKRIEGVDSQDCKKKQLQKLNVFITDLEKTGRILSEREFGRLYGSGENFPTNPVRKVLSVKSVESDNGLEEANEAENSEKEQDKIEEENISNNLDNLKRLACDIFKLAYRDHIVIDPGNNEVVRTHHRTNQKTIYRFCQPDIFDLKYPSSQPSGITVEREGLGEKPRSKLGRPRKRLKEEDEVLKSSPKIIKKEMTSISIEIKPDLTPATITHSRTRSGRLVRTPWSVKENSSEVLTTTAEESISNLLNDLKDVSYHNSKLDALSKIQEQPPTPPAIPSDSNPPIDQSVTTSSPKRKVPPEAICPTCHKIFLGKRLQRHFAQHPDHIKLPSSTNNVDQPIAKSPEQQPLNTTMDSSNNDGGEDMSLFRFLVNKLQRSHQLNEDQKADLFLSELNDLVEQLQLRSSRLIRNTSGLHFVTQRCSKLLGIPEGQYALDLTAIESPMEPEMQDNTNSHNQTSSSSSSLPTHINTRSLDYTHLSITLDDTLTDEAAQKLNLSAGGKLLPPSEESLLRAVDDLVQTNISKIQTTAVCASDTSLATSNTNTTSVVANLLPPHIDHVSDNAVEAVNMKETSSAVVTSASENPLLDLSVDFFQFNN